MEATQSGAPERHKGVNVLPEPVVIDNDGPLGKSNRVATQSRGDEPTLRGIGRPEVSALPVLIQHTSWSERLLGAVEEWRAELDRWLPAASGPDHAGRLATHALATIFGIAVGVGGGPLVQQGDQMATASPPPLPVAPTATPAPVRPNPAVCEPARGAFPSREPSLPMALPIAAVPQMAPAIVAPEASAVAREPKPGETSAQAPTAVQATTPTASPDELMVDTLVAIQPAEQGVEPIAPTKDGAASGTVATPADAKIAKAAESEPAVAAVEPSKVARKRRGPSPRVRKARQRARMRRWAKQRRQRQQRLRRARKATRLAGSSPPKQDAGAKAAAAKVAPQARSSK